MNQYQQDAMKTAFYPDRNKLVYPALGLAGEAGEVANRVQKLMRDADVLNPTPEERDLIAHELGDCLWFIAAIAHDIGFNLQEIANMNLAKLESRYSRGKIGGSGDYR